MKRKKFGKLKVLFYVFAVMAIAIMLVGGLLALMGNGLIMLIAGFVGTVTFLTLGSTFADKQHRTCGECGADLRGCEWGYQAISAKERYSEKDKRVLVDYVFEINTTCPSCGNVDYFNVKMTLKEEQNPKAAIERC